MTLDTIADLMLKGSAGKKQCQRKYRTPDNKSCCAMGAFYFGVGLVPRNGTVFDGITETNWKYCINHVMCHKIESDNDKGISIKKIAAKLRAGKYGVLGLEISLEK